MIQPKQSIPITQGNLFRKLYLLTFVSVMNYHIFKKRKKCNSLASQQILISLGMTIAKTVRNTEDSAISTSANVVGKILKSKLNMV